MVQLAQLHPHDDFPFFLSFISLITIPVITNKSIKDIYNEFVKDNSFDEKPIKGVVLNFHTDRVFLHGTLCRYINSDLKKEVWDEYLIKVGYYRSHKKKKEEKN